MHLHMELHCHITAQCDNTCTSVETINNFLLLGYDRISKSFIWENNEIMMIYGYLYSWARCYHSVVCQSPVGYATRSIARVDLSKKCIDLPPVCFPSSRVKKHNNHPIFLDLVLKEHSLAPRRAVALQLVPTYIITQMSSICACDFQVWHFLLF